MACPSWLVSHSSIAAAIVGYPFKSVFFSNSSFKAVRRLSVYSFLHGIECSTIIVATWTPTFDDLRALVEQYY